MKRDLTLGSLFDGSGGFPLGGLLAGITPIWASEIEPFPIRVTSKRIPTMKHLGDISRIRGDTIEPVSIITFGSPCTDMSVAGKRAGFPDWWCSSLETDSPSESEIAMWREIFETHRRITAPEKKPKTDRQIVKWLKQPYSDSAEYRMWGNGVALPCVFFVLAGIAYYHTRGEP